MKKYTALVTGIVLFALVFTACDLFTGAAGSAGIPGISGTNGVPGTQSPGGSVMVYDSSATPRFLGYLLSTDGTYPCVLSPTGYVVQYDQGASSALYSSIIYFSGVNQTGAPYNSNYGFAKSVFYNPHSGGTFYTYTSGFPADTATWYQSTYDASGNPTNNSYTSIYCRLNPGIADNPANRAVFGIPAVGTITTPFQYSVTPLE
jgi:hypothetical protein